MISLCISSGNSLSDMVEFYKGLVRYLVVWDHVQGTLKMIDIPQDPSCPRLICLIARHYVTGAC